MKNKYASKDSSRKSFDRQAATYDSDRNGAHARYMYAHVLEKMHGATFSNILDVGCGTGEMLKRIAENFPDARLTGLDLSPKMLETAGEKLGCYSATTTSPSRGGS